MRSHKSKLILFLIVETFIGLKVPKYNKNMNNSNVMDVNLRLKFTTRYIFTLQILIILLCIWVEFISAKNCFFFNVKTLQ